jgi:hypothetical protein
VAEEIGNPFNGEEPIEKEPTISVVTRDNGGLSKQKSEWFRPTSKELIQGVEIRRELSTDHELCFIANNLCVFIGTFGTHPGIGARILTNLNGQREDAPDRYWVNIEWLSDNEAVRIGDIIGLSKTSAKLLYCLRSSFQLCCSITDQWITNCKSFSNDERLLYYKEILPAIYIPQPSRPRLSADARCRS